MNDDFLVLGKMGVAERAQKLMELGELGELSGLSDEETLQTGLEVKHLFSMVPKPYDHSSHAFGFLDDVPSGADLVTVRSAAGLEPDASLVGARIDVTLERLRVAAYPGRGTHRILFDFFVQSQREGGTDDVHFNVVVRSQDGGSAAVLGVPIFVGLGVGSSGLSLRVATVNVKNDDDETLLAALESDSMKHGLRLLSTVQPAVGIVSSMALGITKTLAKRTRNVAVQDFAMGLDLGGTATGARLRLGTYFAVQVPDDVLATCWDDWAYNPRSGLLVKRSAPSQPIPYNYVAFGVRRHGGA